MTEEIEGRASFSESAKQIMICMVWKIEETLRTRMQTSKFVVHHVSTVKRNRELSSLSLFSLERER